MRVGGAPPTPFTLSTITYKAVVYAPAERADIHYTVISLFLLYPYIYSVGGVAPPPLTTTLFISGSIDISFKDDVTVVPLLI